MKLIRGTILLLPFLIVLAVVVGGIAFIVSRTDAGESELSSVQHQIHFIDGLHHAVINYNMEGFYGIALETEHQIREAQIYLEEGTSATTLGEACDSLQQSIFCQG